MGGKSSGQTTTSSQTQPWQPTQPLLNNIIGGLGTQYGSQAPTNPAEQTALNQIQANASSIPSYGPQATSLVNDLFTGGPNFQPQVSDAISQYQQQLTPYAQGQYLDPTQAPGMQNVLDTIRNDTSNQINGLFAGAGRDLSGAHVQTLARGISQGEAQPLLNQYQTNQGIQQNAINNLFQGGLLGAQTQSGLYQTGLGNRLTGLSTAPQIATAANTGPQSILDANQAQRNLPLSNIGNIENLLLPIAGLGSQSNGQSNTTQQMSGAQQFATIMSGLGALMPKGPMNFSFGG